MEKLNILTKIIILSVIIVLLFSLLIIISMFDGRIQISKNRDFLYADSMSFIFYSIKYKNFIRQKILPFENKFGINIINGKEIINIIEKKNGFYIKSNGKSGFAEIEILIMNNRFKETVTIRENYSDFDLDGFPDAAEITDENDRKNFIDWFVSIAESQFYSESYSWYEIHKDCAGLIVFSYKEALKKHDNSWHKDFVYLVNEEISDVEKFNYPDIPLIKDKIFRTVKGPFTKNDLNGDVFCNTSDVNNLVNFNLTFISKDLEDFKKGDVLFFIVKDNMPMPFHSMIYNRDNNMLIYHTGPQDDNPQGEMRKVSIYDLMKHPDKTWHPIKDNPSFLGAYRWNIII